MEKKTGLVITMKLGEPFNISDNIEVTIEERTGNYVRVRIKAPKDIKITRKNYIDKGFER